MKAMMLFTAPPQPNESMANAGKSHFISTVKESEQTSHFFDLLHGKIQETKEVEEMETEESSSGEVDLMEELQTMLLQLEEDELKDVITWLDETLDLPIEQRITDLADVSREEQVEELRFTLNDVSMEELQPFLLYLQEITTVEEKNENYPVLNIQTPSLVTHEKAANIPPFQQLFQQVEQLLEQMETSRDFERVAPKLLDYLAKWQQLADKAGLTIPQSISSLEGNKQTASVWQNLIQLYQQKMNLHTKNVYALESKVSSTDVVRWLGNMLRSNVLEEKSVVQQTQAPLPIAKVEQFVIHIPQGKEAQTVDRSLIEQFQRLMDVSRPVLMQPKGQLAITLKPANLGEMVVRFTQVNGETMVKIMVTTTMAKEMLEGNMQQLRHMFAPHQVVIEKQEMAAGQAEGAQKENESDREDETQEEHSSRNKEEEKDDSKSFSSMFEDLILNEKV